MKLLLEMLGNGLLVLVPMALFVFIPSLKEGHLIDEED